MKIQLTLIDKSIQVVDYAVYAENSEEEAFQTFLQHFKNAGYFVTVRGKEAILYHTLVKAEVVPDEVVLPKPVVKELGVEPRAQFKRVKAGEKV